MNHVDPSMSSGSSPGGTLAIAPDLHHNPAADSQSIPLDADAAKFGDCGIRVDEAWFEIRELFSNPAKFRMFAFVSALLVPNASKLMRRFLRHQKFREKQLRKDEQLERQIELREQGEIRFEEILDRFEEDARELWWFPNATVKNISAKGGLGRPPHWHGEPRPYGARQVQIKTRFPSIGFLTYLVRDLGYDGRAAFAAMVKAHQPWLHCPTDRRISINGSPAVSVRPVLAMPSRRTKTGGGLTEKQVRQALAKKRWTDGMKKAVFEIVYRRRSTLEVSNESAVPADTLYVYASRLRGHIAEADLRAEKNLSLCFQQLTSGVVKDLD